VFVRGIEQLAARNHNQVNVGSSRQGEVLTENLSNQAFSAVSLDRAAKLPRGDDPEPLPGTGDGRGDDREVSAVRPCPRVENVLKLSPVPDAFVFPETPRSTAGG
jgi:hypothetical protein